MRVIETQAGDATILALSGRMTLGESSVSIRLQVRDALASGARTLILDLSDLTYMDSAGLGELVSAFTATRNSGGNLLLVGLSKKIRDLLQVTKLITVFPIFDTTDQAISWVASRPPERHE